MHEPKRPLKVFLCHAHADRDAVRALYTRLTNDGVDAWLDKEKLLGGQNWRMEIRAAVEEADVVIVCHSKEFNKEGFRQREVKWALDAAMEKPEGTIFIIPARLEECEVIKSLSDWHWVDLFESNGYDMLMRALRARANNIGATLQIKRSWLPKITSPLPKKQKPVENKVVETSDEKIVNNVDGMSPLPELPDESEAQWQAAFVKNAKEEKEPVETTDTKVDRPSAKENRKSNTTIIVSFIVLVMASIFGLPSLFNNPVEEPSPTQTETVTVLETQTTSPSSTPSIPTSTKTPEFTATPTPLPTEITDARGVVMRLIPAGEFTMGSDSKVYLIDNDEKPAHKVYLDAYWMDQTEVTNAMYSQCVQSGICSLPGNAQNFNNEDYADHPVVYVSWEDAKTYCEWRMARLPTEAEWENARQSVVGGYGCNKNNYGTCVGETAPVGSYENGGTYGLYDMAGNVWEWVADWYDENYYANSPYLNPLGPDATSGYKVLRGGAWGGTENDLSITERRWGIVSNKLGSVGFRCAKDVQ